MGKHDSYGLKESKQQDRVELATKVVEGLTDDALKCAMDLGRDQPIAEDGDVKIAKATKESWAGKLETATKELYREGGKKDGVLARAIGERMSSYVSRRKRWYRRTRSFHPRTFAVGNANGVCRYFRSPAATCASCCRETTYVGHGV